MATGMFGTYDLTAGTKISMEDMISLLDPHDAPLYGKYDMDGRTAIRTGRATQRKEEWLDDSLLNPRTTASVASTTSETVLTVTNRLAFTTNDVLLTPNNEYVFVDGYGTTANTLLITREFNSSTGATIASSADLVGVGTALPEGSDPKDGRYVDRNARYNYTQIFGPYKIEVSATEQVIDKYGLVGTEMDYQIAKHIMQFAVQMEQAILYGTRSISTSAENRTMGGLKYFLTTNVNTTTTDLTESAFRSALQTTYSSGGRSTWAIVPPAQKSKISQFSTSIILLDRTDRTRGQVVDIFESDFAAVSIMLDRWVRTQDLFIVDGDQMELLTLRELQFERLGKTGDAEKGFLVAEKTLKVHRQSHAYMFTALQA